MVDARVTSIISTYQEGVSEKLNYIRRHMDARHGVPVCTYKLFIAFLFSDYDAGVHFLEDVGLIPNSVMSCKC
jgi:hypothetical protein